MGVEYGFEPDLPAEAFRQVLIESTLSERRPVDDLPRLEAMLRNADVIATAREDGRLIGVARSVSDFSYCCYLADLAVASSHQRRGIGRRLIEETRARAGETAMLILVAAPAAEGYYPKLGMKHLHSTWAIPRTR